MFWDKHQLESEQYDIRFHQIDPCNSSDHHIVVWYEHYLTKDILLNRTKVRGSIFSSEFGIGKDLFETKLKKCAYFRLISCHFFANDMIIFHKTEVQKIILRCLTGLNSDWFNNYDTKCKYFHFRFFAILYKNTHLHFLCFCVLCHNFCTT